MYKLNSSCFDFTNRGWSGGETVICSRFTPRYWLLHDIRWIYHYASLPRDRHMVDPQQTHLHHQATGIVWHLAVLHIHNHPSTERHIQPHRGLICPQLALIITKIYIYTCQWLCAIKHVPQHATQFRLSQEMVTRNSMSRAVIVISFCRNSTFKQVTYIRWEYERGGVK